MKPIDVMRACLDAWATRDREALERLIAPDFHFTSPLDNELDREAYFRICWPGGKDLVAFDILHHAEVGDRVFTNYEARMKSGQRFRNTELSTVRDGKLVSTEVYFGWTVPHKVKKGEHSDK